MVGDAVRIPVLQQSVKEIYGLDISKTLSPDECVARGTSLYVFFIFNLKAAMNSPYFSLKEYVFEHCNTYSIIFEYPFIKNDQVEIRNTKLIQKGELFPSRKSIKFTEKQIPKETVLDMKFYYSNEEITFLKQNLLSKKFFNILENYMISIPQVKEEQYTLVMEFYLDQNGLFNLDKAFISETYLEDKVIPVTTASSTTTNTTTTETKTEEKKEEKIEKVKKERKTNCIIKLVTCTYGNNPSALTSMIQKEATNENEDKNLKYVKDKRNELETFMYTIKENFTGSLQGFADEKEVENLLNIMKNTEDWIYNNAEDTYVKPKIEEHYNFVVIPGSKIYKRKENWENLETSLNQLKNAVNSNITNYDIQFNLAKENKSILLKGEMDELSNIIQQYNDSYNNTIPVCIKSPRFMDAPVEYASIDKLTKELEEKIRKIFSEAERRAKEAEKKLQEEKKKQEENDKKTPNTQTGEKMQVD